MKTYRLIFLFVFAMAALTVFESCKDDDNGPETDPLVGQYVITSVVVNEDIVVEEEDTTVAAGTNITQALTGLLLADAGCTNPANTRIEINQDGKVYYVCMGEGISNQKGTWDVDDARTKLDLVLNLSFSPAPVLITLESLVETSTSISGDISIPLPGKQFFGPDAPTLVPANLAVSFTKQ